MSRTASHMICLCNFTDARDDDDVSMSLVAGSHTAMAVAMRLTRASARLHTRGKAIQNLLSA